MVFVGSHLEQCGFFDIEFANVIARHSRYWRGGFFEANSRWSECQHSTDERLVLLLSTCPPISSTAGVLQTRHDARRDGSSNGSDFRDRYATTIS
jgi:hypothetical protein